MELGPRFVQAFDYALKLHSTADRKSGVPTISHLMAVSGLVLENRGSENEAIAALLHDAAEDHGGEPRLKEIEAQFGTGVANLVEECSDSLPLNKRERVTWVTRKQAFIRRLPELSEGAWRIEVADKLHNARMTYRDLRLLGNGLWERLDRSAEQTVAHFAIMHRVLERQFPNSQTTELGLVVSRHSCVPACLNSSEGNSLLADKRVDRH